jgi:hypothetical protein
MDINEEIRKASLPQLISWWIGKGVPTWANATALLNDKVAFALRRKGTDGIQFLKTQIDTKDIRKRYLVLRALADKDTYDDEVVEFLINAFRINPGYETGVADAFKGVAMDCLVDIGEYPLDRSEIDALLEHKDKWLGASAMVYLSHAFPEETEKILKAGLNNANPKKRGKACTQAGFRNVKELKDDVRMLLKDSDDYVARSAQIACEMFDIVWSGT